MTDTTTIAARYRAFAEQEALGSSPAFFAWATAVAGDPDVLEFIAQLPAGKQQPNLVFAAARIHGAVPGDCTSLRETLVTARSDVRATVMARSTQTNEAARCAALLLGLQAIPGPIALLEVGAAAGLCLLPDRYSYTFSDGTRLDPVEGPSRLSIPIAVHGGLAPPSAMPEIVWRGGLDLNPLDPAGPRDLAWLEALIWPEHEERRARLVAAASIAAAHDLHLRRGNLLTDLAAAASEAPTDATLVVTHSATLAYLTDDQRTQAVREVEAIDAHRISFESRGVDPSVRVPSGLWTPRTLFVAALDGCPYALADGHGTHLSPCGE